MTSWMWLVTCNTIEFDKNVCQTKLRYIIKIFCRSRGEVVNNGSVSAKSWPLVFSPLNCFCLIWFQFFADFIFVTIVDTYWSHIILIVVKQSRVRYLFNHYLTFLHNIFIIPAHVGTSFPCWPNFLTFVFFNLWTEPRLVLDARFCDKLCHDHPVLPPRELRSRLSIRTMFSYLSLNLAIVRSCYFRCSDFFVIALCHEFKCIGFLLSKPWHRLVTSWQHVLSRGTMGIL